MEKAKKGVRICLLCVVITAIIMGIFYYFSEVQNQSLRGEGTLVSAFEHDGSHLWE